ncbi:MAG: glucose-1-phosphate thymidylyltransferase RfbA [Methanomassiliicoccaceae archaeon]|nr:glucose-1-phosphate thymidylyltransferase RfbA [Methanomassiliicoccaceae archaeon]
MKGIILAAGKGTRLHPISQPISKILLPVYNKPMIYYPLSTLMLAGVRDIMIITNQNDQENFKRTLKDGSRFGIRISYAIQKMQKGIADAFIIAEDFIAGDNVVLILGDNIYHGEDMKELLKQAARNEKGATVFVYEVGDPERFGVAELDGNGNVLSLEEKPSAPRSNHAVTGLYFYDGSVCGFAKDLKPSPRGELEITDLNELYLKNGALKACIMDSGYVWMDAGTFDSLYDAHNTIRNIEKREEKMVACPEETAMEQGFIDPSVMKESIKDEKSEYYDYVRKKADNLLGL